MRVSLSKRLGKLEQAVPSKIQVEDHRETWREVLREFGLPPETPVPNHMPIVIRQLIQADGTPSDRLLSLNGRFVAKQHNQPSSAEDQVQ